MLLEMTLDSALPPTRRSQMTCMNWSRAIACACIIKLVLADRTQMKSHVSNLHMTN